MSNLKIIQYQRLYGCSFDIGDRSMAIKAYFTLSSEASKLCKLPIGYYGGKGAIVKKDIEIDKELPEYFESFIQWARANLTMGEYEKYIN